jgi:hypothetical protein
MDSREVVTIFCCGTNSSRNQSADEAVAFCWDNTTSRKFILDGPGSVVASNPDAAILKSKNILRAVESRKKGFFGRDKGPGNVKESLFEEKRNYTLKTNVEGSLHGVGWADNVIMAIQWLWEQYYVGSESENRNSFSRVNLVGWSRGAVTCIMLAHAIREAGFMFGAHGNKLPNTPVEINIFAFDPVPGGWNDFKANETFDSSGRVGSPDRLPENVVNFRSVLMENNESKLFKCVCPGEFRGALGGYMEYPLPGRHSDCVKFNKADNPVGIMGLHLCQQFLKEFDTQGTFDRILNASEVLELYAQMRLKVGGDKGKIAKARGNIQNYKRKDVFYMNGHHFEILQRTWPNLHAAISGDLVLNEYQRTVYRNIAPNTWRAIQEFRM